MNIKIDVERQEVTVGNRPLRLPPREFTVLRMLAEANGRVLSRDKIMQAILGTDVSGINSRAVDQYVARLRSKARVPIIRTVTGSGYSCEVAEIVNAPKNYASIQSIDRQAGTAVVAFDVSRADTLKIGGAVLLA